VAAAEYLGRKLCSKSLVSTPTIPEFYLSVVSRGHQQVHVLEELKRTYGTLMGVFLVGQLFGEFVGSNHALTVAVVA
jgi:hypothetical protein